MTDYTRNETSVSVSGIKGALRHPSTCGFFTAATQFQAGLKSEDGSGPRRLFFGTQTEAESFAKFKEIFEAGFHEKPVQVKLSGYYNQRPNDRGLDDDALFVETFEILA